MTDVREFRLSRRVLSRHLNDGHGSSCINCGREFRIGDRVVSTLMRDGTILDQRNHTIRIEQ